MAVQDQDMQDAIEILEELREDNTIPKNVRNSIERVIASLKDEKSDMSIRIDRAMQELDDISADINLQPYSRSQLWHIASMLENFQN